MRSLCYLKLEVMAALLLIDISSLVLISGERDKYIWKSCSRFVWGQCLEERFPQKIRKLCSIRKQGQLISSVRLSLRLSFDYSISIDLLLPVSEFRFVNISTKYFVLLVLSQNLVTHRYATDYQWSA
jgi:hypothetical protein